MAGISNLPFRLLARQYNCALVYSEMVSAKGLVYNLEHNKRYLLSHPADAPLAVQLFGAEPDILAEAAQIAVTNGADIIDINMGCPVKKVVKTGAGCALMREPRLIERIIKKVRLAIGVPLTIKLRAGWDNDRINAVQIARIAQDEGVDGITLHGRTRAQGFTGKADWRLISQIKKTVSCAVIGNGDVKTPEDAKRMIKETGCDGVMIGRAARGNPWLFAQVVEYLKSGKGLAPPSLSERKETIIRHFELLGRYYGSPFDLLHIRKHLIWYTQGLPNSSHFRRSINTIQSKAAFLQLLENYWSYFIPTIHTGS